jgi:hypothetical protein
VSQCVSPTVARQRLRKNITAARKTHATIGLLDASFSYSVRAVSKEIMQYILRRTFCSCEGNKGERIELKPMHVAAKLTIFYDAPIWEKHGKTVRDLDKIFRICQIY